MLSRYVEEGPTPIYSLAGPPNMVYGLREMLTQAGVGNSSIRAEEFYGY
jgi:hypothetical protein